MPKMKGTEFANKIKDKIADLKKQAPSKNPIVQADSVKVLMALERLLTPALVYSDLLLTEVDLQPFYDLLKEQEKLQCTVVSYFHSPESMGNQLYFLLSEILVAHNSSHSRFELLLPSAYHDEWLKVNSLGTPDLRDKKLKGFMASDDGRHVIDIQKCLADASERKETTLFHSDSEQLTNSETARVIGHSSFTEAYFDELKLYEAEAKQKTFIQLKNSLKTKDKDFIAQLKSGSLELKNCYGDKGDKCVIDAVFSKMATKDDLIDFLLQMPNRKWMAFVTSAYKHIDLYKLILNGAKNVDGLLDKETLENEKPIDDTRMFAKQFLAATAYSIERNKAANLTWKGWFLSVLPSSLTTVYSKQPKLNCNDVLMHFLCLPPPAIKANSLIRFAENNLEDKNTKPMIGNHTLGQLTKWVQKHSAADRQDISNDMTLDMAASRVVPQ